MADAKADKAQDPVIVYLFTRVVGLLVVLYGAWAAFDIRTYAIQDYGRIIHECAAPPSAESPVPMSNRWARRSRAPSEVPAPGRPLFLAPHATSLFPCTQVRPVV